MPPRACSGTRASAPTTTSSASSTSPWRGLDGADLARQPDALRTRLAAPRPGRRPVSGELWVALLLLRLLAVAGVVVMAWAVPDVARRIGWSPVRALWLGVAVPLVGAHFVGGAHNDALMVAAVLGGLALALRGRFVLACVVIALGAMVKVTAVIALPFVVVLWARHVAAARAPGTGDPAYARWGDVLRAGALTLVCAGSRWRSAES